MKFKKDDMVLYLPCSDPRTSPGYVIMYVMGYDEKSRDTNASTLGYAMITMKTFLIARKVTLASSL